MCTCDCSGGEGRSGGRRWSPVRLVLDLALAYVLLVFGGGTLIRTGHPVAVEAGRIMHTVTFVEPTIAWADHNDHETVASGLRALARVG